jgi:tetratricopeptide (TPR) repeat protein
VVLYTLIRFSRWDDLLREPAPPADLKYTLAVWHYGRGLAFAAQGALDSASAERDSLAAVAARIPPETMANLNSERALLQVAERHLAAELAARGGRPEEAVKAYREGIAVEDELTYDEPSAWALPLRQQLGGLLLAAGRPKEAEKAYREDLVRYPNNGWSLSGLARALKAQGRSQEASAAEADFRKVWSKADVTIALAH